MSCFGEALINRLFPCGDDRGRDCLGGAPANAVYALARLAMAGGLLDAWGVIYRYTLTSWLACGTIPLATPASAVDLVLAMMRLTPQGRH